jgi:hypothetical protein
MSFLTAKPAGFSQLSPYLIERAIAELLRGNGSGTLRPSCNRYACSYRNEVAANLRSQGADEDFAMVRVFHYVSRLLHSHRFGVFPAPGGTWSSASRFAPPSGSRFLPKEVCKPRQETPCKFLSGPSQKADLRHLGAGPTRKASPSVTRATTGIQQMETPLCT